MNFVFSKSDLLEFFYTREDVEEFLSEVRLLLDSLYTSGENDFVHVLASRVRMSTSRLVRDICTQEGIGMSDIQKIRELLLQMEGIVQGFSVVHVTLAVEPTEVLLGEVVGFVREFLVKESVVDLVVDRSILGGVVLDFAGKYWDFSVKKKVADIFDRVVF